MKRHLAGAPIILLIGASTLVAFGNDQDASAVTAKKSARRDLDGRTWDEFPAASA